MQLTITLPKLHKAQQDVIQDSARFKVLAAGRRFGKSRMGALNCLTTALKGGRAWWVSPSYPMAMIGWRELRRLAGQILGVNINKSERMITFPGGGYIQVKSSDNPDSLRGEGLDFVVMDECAFMVSETWTEALRPALADRKGKALFISTPKGFNFFHKLWAINDGDFRSWRYPTSENPFIDKTEIEAARRELPERTFQQEFLAEFLADGAFFQNIDAACVVVEREQPDAHFGHRLCAGIDFAMSEDYTVVTVACQQCKRVVDWDRFNQIDYTYQRERIRSMVERWRCAILPERNSIGQPNIEILRQMGMNVLRGADGGWGFSTTATTKPELIQSLAAGLEHDGFRVPLEYADELRSYQVEVSAMGHARFNAPSGLHDDRVISLALAWKAIVSMDKDKFEVTENPFY